MAQAQAHAGAGAKKQAILVLDGRSEETGLRPGDAAVPAGELHEVHTHRRPQRSGRGLYRLVGGGDVGLRAGAGQPLADENRMRRVKGGLADVQKDIAHVDVPDLSRLGLK